jgi:SAM-dependent methyltransferase
LLDAGCGTQPYRKYCEALEYRAQDFGEYDGQGDGAGLQSNSFKYGEIHYRSDIWSIPEKSAHFDAILCSEVIEHIPYPNEAIREFARLLKPGGTLILTAPFCSVPHMTPYYFYNGFSKDYYRYILKSSGFELESIKASGDPFMYLIQEQRRLFSLKLPIVLKFALWPGFLLSFPILRLLSLFTAKSTELDYLVFGYFIRARRI